MNLSPKSEVPAHVHADQVFDFDIYAEPRLFEDLHLGWHTLHAQAPDIFYTPRNGGHWIVTRHDLQAPILRDPEHFSNRQLDIPNSNSPFVMIPLNLDPPEHMRYRLALMKHFDAKAVAAMMPSLREWANRLIDRVIERGTCDFAEELGAAFPVSVIMTLLGMPLERFDEFRNVVLEYFSKTTVERRLELQNIIFGINRDLIAQKRQNPQDDLYSTLLKTEVDGRPLTQAELESIGFLLFIGGLDTVANALTFAFYHLSGDPDLQRRLAAEPARISDFVEESLRRYAVVNQTRIVNQDIDLGGASFRKGDMVLCPLTLAGMDERKNPQPERFDLDRERRAHMTFSTGAHLCIGNLLARAEMRLFTEIWLQRVPQCRRSAGLKAQWRPGLVMALMHLPIEWDVAPRQAA